jgi:hypothetical protein
MTTTQETPKSILDKVAKLIAQAESEAKLGENTAAEKFLAKADAMMVKYAIDRAVIESRKTAGEKREEPVSVTVPFVRDGVDFEDQYTGMFSAICNHNRTRAVIRTYREQAVIVGFPTDVEYTQMIWNSVYLAFVSKLDPSWVADRPADENIKILKEAGWKWSRIADSANANGFECTATDGRLKAAYRRQCRLEGVEPTSHTQRHAAYRAAYAEAFAGTIQSRLYRMRRAAEDQVTNRRGTGTELALRSRADTVNEEFYRLFPHLRPMSEEERAASLERSEAYRKAEESRLAAMTPAQRAAEERREAREQARWEAQYEREQAKKQDKAGRRAGQAAAASVDLGATKVGSEQRKAIK